MILIVMCHVLVHGKIIDNTSGTIKLVSTYMNMLCLVHVNSFILVSVYYQCESKFNIKKVWNILISSWFYRIIIILLITFMAVSLSKIEIIRNTLFLLNNNYWFIGAYLIVCVLSPFINKFIKTLSKKQYYLLIILLFLLISVISNLNIPNIFLLDSNQVLSFILSIFIAGTIIGNIKNFIFKIIGKFILFKKLNLFLIKLI